MSVMDKTAVGKQTGKFMQHRQRTRPYRAETLLAREDERKPSEVFQPEEKYEKALAADEGEEFVKDQKIPVEVSWETQKNTAIRGGPGTNTFARSLLKERSKTSAEFAPGIPEGRVIKPVPSVKEQEPNQEWTVSLSKHPAARRGDHHDLRLVDPKGRAHSWAFNDMPEPGRGTYAAQQATHTKSYALRTKPFSIPIESYGGTRPGAKVEPKYVQPAEVISASRNKIHFLRHQGQETEEFVLKKVSDPPKGNPLWALRNATKTRNTQEGRKLPDSKPKYKEVAPEQIDLTDEQQVMTPKLDGAHALVHFPKKGRMMRVYSYRPTQRKSGLIEHTFKFPDFQNRKTPKSLQGTLLRAEVWASTDGKAIPATELGGILNSSVPKSRQKQQDEGVDLRITGLDVLKHRGKNYESKGYEDRLNVLEKVRKQTGGIIEMLPVARTADEKKKLLSTIKKGALPETKEGVVLQDLAVAAPPTKAKFRPDHDVYVRKIYQKERTKAKGQAAGFGYSFEPTGPVVGRVGTGLSGDLRVDMAQNPEKYVGRVAKVQSAGRYERRDKSQGALVGSPAFKEWHIDKTPPELLKEASSLRDRRPTLYERIRSWRARKKREESRPRGTVRAPSWTRRAVERQYGSPVRVGRIRGSDVLVVEPLSKRGSEERARWHGISAVVRKTEKELAEAPKKFKGIAQRAYPVRRAGKIKRLLERMRRGSSDTTG